MVCAVIMVDAVIMINAVFMVDAVIMLPVIILIIGYRYNREQILTIGLSFSKILKSKCD